MKAVDAPPPVTLQGMLLGARLVFPFIPGSIVFAAAFGTTAAQKGLSVLETVLMSALMYAGSAQLVALELWRTDVWTGAAILAISAVVFTVNARMILQGASLQPWIYPLPNTVLWPSLGLLTDANWVVGTRYHAGGGRDVGVLIGAGIMLWIVWVGGTLPGRLAGGLVQHPERFGIDLVMPIVFTAMVVPLWKGRQDTICWAASALVALATAWLWPGYAFVVTGGLAGALTGAALGVLEDRRRGGGNA
ncbi:branched-chain amino acid ABC transporter permease [Alsobacter soli]|uniref:Branched-chain amino acid ABC transporter permease n=1 Tax=Alsobacter soli TaxID=2109933 RepID=A0A2T1HYL8_9HYPH|nr:AzlC family ABC transporter permease [Alsobacter soli]PSC06761.1 branched-chain amino acid ABC transporter permease [Alsobacter soli]